MDNDARFRPAYWLARGPGLPEEYQPLVRDDCPDDDFGEEPGVGATFYLRDNGNCPAPTAKGECGFPLDARGSCGVESQHWEEASAPQVSP